MGGREVEEILHRLRGDIGETDVGLEESAADAARVAEGGDDQRVGRRRVLAAGRDRRHEADRNRNVHLRDHRVRALRGDRRAVHHVNRAGVRAGVQQAARRNHVQRDALRLKDAARWNDREIRPVDGGEERGRRRRSGQEERLNDVAVESELAGGVLLLRLRVERDHEHAHDIGVRPMLVAAVADGADAIEVLHRRGRHGVRRLEARAGNDRVRCAREIERGRFLDFILVGVRHRVPSQRVDRVGGDARGERCGRLRRNRARGRLHDLEVSDRRSRQIARRVEQRLNEPVNRAGGQRNRMRLGGRAGRVDEIGRVAVERREDLVADRARDRCP